MYCTGQAAGGSTNRRWLWTGLIAAVVLLGAPMVAAQSLVHPTAAAPSAYHALPPNAPGPANGAANALAPVPLGPGVSGTFYRNVTVGGGQSAHLYCDTITFPFGGNYTNCFPDASSPNVLPLPNGNIGYTYANIINFTSSTCPMAFNNTESRIAFTLSTDGGATFSPFRDIGNNTCPYYQALEPSFKVSSSGDIFGTFVEANATPSELNCPGTCSNDWGQAQYYAPRNDDALAFTYSTDSGVSFHNVTTIQNAGHGNIAVPSLAAYGKTVYIAYMNISNTTAGATLGGSTSTPVSVELVWSNNSGKFWRGPITLRGFNASESYNAMDPQVVVAPNGTVLVAYSTNRHCIAYCATTSQVYGDDIELAASGNNGTTWSTYLVAKDFGTGEYLGTQPAGLYYYPTISGSGSSTGPWIFEQGPMISLAVSPTGGHIYVAWAGGVNQSAPPYCCDTYQEYSITQLFVGVSSNGGASWANTTLDPEVQQGADLYEGGVSLPGLGVSPTGTVYLTFQYLNGSSGVNCLNQGVFGANYQMTQFVATSANGLSWNSPVTTAWNLQGNGGWWTMGWWSSVAFNVSTGAPLIGYTLPIAQSVIGSFTSFPGVVQLASGWVGTTTSLTLTETNLTAGTPWSAWVDGNVFSSSSSSMTVTNVPSGPDVWVSTANPIPVSAGYGAAYLPTMQFLTPIRLVGPTTFFFNYSLFYDLNISTNPAMTGYTGFGISAGLFSINNYFMLGQFAGGCPFPWFVPAGLHVDMVSGGARDYYNLPVGASYWNGTGTGSFTGPGVAGAWAMGGPVNETIWYTAYSTYNVSVGALGIPGGALVHFKWDGTAHTFTAPNLARVAGVPTGLHAVTNVSANSSVAGWEYFGTPVGGNPVSIPDTPVVNLSFSFVNIARPVGTVSFHANGLTAGTTWHFEFNGTDYASSTPWINVTGRPGTYPVAAFPVVAANGSAAYAPTGVPSNLSVTTSSTYQVQYTSAFQVVVVAGAGGHVSPSGTSYWVAPGTAMSFTATPVAGSTFGEWTGKGAGSFSGTNPVANFTVEGPIVETASFYAPTANRFSLSFSETGLPSGTWWSVFLDGAGHSTNTPSLNVTGLYSCPTSGSLGSYTVVVPYSYSNTSQGVRYVPGSYRSPLCGGSPPVTIAFSTQYYLTLESTAGGIISAAPTSGLPSSTSLWVAATDSVVLSASANTGYDFLGWNGTGLGNYTGASNPTPSFVLGGPAREVGVFAPNIHPPTPTYSLLFHVSTALAAGTGWTVILQGVPYPSTGTDLVIPGLTAQSYSLSVPTVYSTDGQTQYVAINVPNKVTVSGNATITLSFQTAYWLDIEVAGPGTVSPSSAWVIAGRTVALAATPGANDVFSAWSGTGTGGYTGPQPSANITMSAPIRELATFVPQAPSSTTGTASLWTNVGVLGGLAVLGLLGGLVVGILLSRRRRGGPPFGETRSSHSGEPSTGSPDDIAPEGAEQ